MVCILYNLQIKIRLKRRDEARNGNNRSILQTLAVTRTAALCFLWSNIPLCGILEYLISPPALAIFKILEITFMGCFGLQDKTQANF